MSWIATMDKESSMAGSGSTYERISLRDAVTDAQTKDDLSRLDEPWQPKKARFKMAGRLAIGLLILFGITIACNGTVIALLVVTPLISDKATGDSTMNVKQITEFATTLLPYIATPLGVALGYFFRETEEE
jgi:hypothetical protein